MDKIDNIKESKRKYGKYYNKINITIQLNRDLINDLKEKLEDDVSVKSHIEDLIKKSLKEI